jgi:hypothetical protein
MVGIVDVVTHVELNDKNLGKNRLLKIIREALPKRLPPHFEIIIDYKGMRRSAYKTQGPGPGLWDVYGWQIQTYAHLRSRQDDSLPVVAGVILYVNELLPTREDLLLLLDEIMTNITDVIPQKGSEAEVILKKWQKALKERKTGRQAPVLPVDYRLRRALRVVDVTEQTIKKSLRSFDQVVARIETCRGKEIYSGRVISTWEKNAEDEDTCTACDSRTFCPAYKKETIPQLPGVKIR